MRCLPPGELSYHIDIIDYIYACVHGTFDAHDKFKKRRNKGELRCQFRRFQENPIKGTVYVTTVEDRCSGTESNGPS